MKAEGGTKTRGGGEEGGLIGEGKGWRISSSELELVGFYTEYQRAERDLLSTHDEEEEVESFEGPDLDVLVQQRSSEFEHPERDEAEVPERRFVRLLADSEEDFPRDMKSERGGSKASLEGEEKEGRRKGELLVFFLFKLLSPVLA